MAKPPRSSCLLTTQLGAMDISSWMARRQHIQPTDALGDDRD
ncbi:hypothetical protein DB30_03128 [Enhygromyxa salina]|uniref:Uncharacterized protein n=1 Tax=Enhygromyxa salina TaxID=215803 RepID=A0A0C1Z2F6_9BACT|nr:hypothetical protein DB30_03128 [Enhygromyxa salina]